MVEVKMDPKTKTWLKVIIVIIAIILITIFILKPYYERADVQPKNNVVAPVVPTVTPISTPAPVPVVPTTAQVVYLKDIFGGDLYPLEQEEALERLTFFQEWRGKSLNNELNVERAEGELDLKIKQSIIDPNARIKFLPGGKIKEVIFSYRDGIVSQKNVLTSAMPEGYTTYLIFNIRDPMDQDDQKRIVVAKTFNRNRELVAIMILDDVKHFVKDWGSINPDSGDGGGGENGQAVSSEPSSPSGPSGPADVKI